MFRCELLPAGGSEAVVFGPLTVLGLFPLGSHRSLFLKPMQRRVQGPGFSLENIAGAGPDRLAKTVAVLRPPAEGPKNQHVQRTLEQFDPILIGFALCHKDVDILYACM
jgi:hypothetical protein